MKKQKLLLIASVLLLTCSCQDNIPSSQESQSTSSQDPSSLVSSSSSSSEQASSSSSSSVIVEHSITYVEDPDHKDTEVTIHKNDTDMTEITKAKAGQTILVNLWSSSETITGGYANDIELTPYLSCYYTFTMPDEDVVITVTYSSKGDTPTTSHSITYAEDGKSYVTITKDTAQNIMDGTAKEITSAEAGENVNLFVSCDSYTITVVYANNTLAKEDAEYGWMFCSFTMPDEDVVITITYKGDSTPSSSIQLKTASGVSCDFYSNVEDAIASIRGGHKC